MKGEKRTKKRGEKDFIIKALKGAVMGLIITIVGVLIFAVVIKESGADDQLISAVNQILKVVSIFIAAFIGTRNLESKQIPAGVISGVAYVLLGFFTFSLIEGALGDLPLMLADLAMAAVIGMLTAMIFGRLKRSQKPTKKTHR